MSELPAWEQAAKDTPGCTTARLRFEIVVEVDPSEFPTETLGLSSKTALLIRAVPRLMLLMRQAGIDVREGQGVDPEKRAQRENEILEERDAWRAEALRLTDELKKKKGPSS